MGVIVYADDFIVSSEEREADKVWKETTKALDEIGLEIDQNKSCFTRKTRDKMETQNTQVQERDCCVGDRSHRKERSCNRRNESVFGSENAWTMLLNLLIMWRQ